MRVLAFLNGTMADPEQAQIRVDDLGLLRGDGVFETILVNQGVPRELDAHLERLIHSSALLDLPRPDRGEWESLIRLVLGKCRDESEMALKLVYTRGVEGDKTAKPTGFAIAQPIDGKIIKQRAQGINTITLDRGIDEGLAQRAPWLLLGAKSLSYAINMAAVREAARRGADDVIFTTSGGQVLEGPTSTVVIVRNRTLFTPPTKLGILPGTTQARLFQGATKTGWSTKVEPLEIQDLHDADAVFLVSSVRKITRVNTVDGQALAETPQLNAEVTQAYESEYVR
jgi:4-amino-4-deoxychorismate lyase